MRNVLIAALATLVLTGCGMFVLAKAERDAAGGKSAANSSEDVQFLRDLAHANAAEIRSGRMVAEKAASPQVREHAKQMVDAHTTRNKQAATLAAARGVTLPDDVEPKREAQLRQLEALSGEALERAYAAQQVRDHGEMLRTLERAAADAQNTEVRELAKSALPQVRKHLEAARGLR